MYFWFKTKEKNAGTNKPNTLDQPHSHYSYTAMSQRKKNSIQLARTPSMKDVNMFIVSFSGIDKRFNHCMCMHHNVLIISMIITLLQPAYQMAHCLNVQCMYVCSFHMTTDGTASVHATCMWWECA